MKTFKGNYWLNISEFKEKFNSALKFQKNHVVAVKQIVVSDDLDLGVEETNVAIVAKLNSNNEFVDTEGKKVEPTHFFKPPKEEYSECIESINYDLSSRNTENK